MTTRATFSSRSGTISVGMQTTARSTDPSSTRRWVAFFGSRAGCHHRQRPHRHSCPLASGKPDRRNHRPRANAQPVAWSGRTVHHLSRAVNPDQRAHAPVGIDRPAARQLWRSRRLSVPLPARVGGSYGIGGSSDHLGEDQRRRICSSGGGFRVCGNPEPPLEAGVAVGDGPGLGRSPAPVDGAPVRSRMGLGSWLL